MLSIEGKEEEGRDDCGGEMYDFLFSLSILFLRISSFFLTASRWSLMAAVLTVLLLMTAVLLLSSLLV